MSTVLPGWVADPALSGFWAKVAVRLESTGLTPRGRIVVEVASREERHALGALLGRTLIRDRVQVDLAALDARLAERSPLPGLVEVASAQAGKPLCDRAAERAGRAARREEPLLLARGLVNGHWVDDWVGGLRRTGLLTGRPDAADTVHAAAAVLRALQQPSPVAARSRTDLAAQLLGDAHALDEGRVLTQVVLRGLAAAAGVPVPATAAERRDLWQRHGVHGDLVSATCLVLGLRPQARDPVSTRLLEAAGTATPLHLTAWDLRDWTPGSVEPRGVLVCENPRVLEAVAAEHAQDVAVVCTSGEPNTVVTGVLDRLVSARCRLRYHGDFDWPGVAIANRLVARHGVRPWLMGAADYEAGLHRRALRLGEIAVEPVWDAELGAVMRAHGVAVHEEAVLEQLLQALLDDRPGRPA
jgi:uncharacterized protein (TIGR02679 family)